MAGNLRILGGFQFVLAAVLGFALASCGTEPEDPAIAWITEPPTSDSWTTISNDRLIELPASAVQSAIAELNAQSAVALDRETYARLTQHRPWPSDPALTPYLVRGVALEEPLGGLYYLQDGNELLIQYNGPIVRARPYRLPAIVLLSTPPTKVYITINLYG